ncbi:hypothetical protein [Peribacillus sp. SCS-37]|uniref:hypothetical protein n=1 Tax=Paraperibacillus esterisolvens TaxID=3115296 RepID=UPI0039060D51
MDYDARIAALSSVIGSFSGAQRVDLVCPAPAPSDAWDNSEAKQAEEDWNQRMDAFLAEADVLLTSCISALQSQLAYVIQLKEQELRMHLNNMVGLKPEERADYINTAQMDPSVRKLLH